MSITSHPCWPAPAARRLRTGPAGPQTVALTGGSGFVGRCVLQTLLAAGHRVRALARDPRRFEAPSDAQIASRLELVAGALADEEALANLVRGAQVVVHMVGIIKEDVRHGQSFEQVHVQSTQRLLQAAQTQGVSRWIHMSALGARAEGPSLYHRTKWMAEETVRASNLAWTIFRPSVILGPGGEFVQMLSGFCRDLIPPFMPYFAGGRLGRGRVGQLQPVSVEDVAYCFVQSLALPRTQRHTYELGGPQAFTWPQLYRAFQLRWPGARRWKRPVPIPAWLALHMARLPGMPFNAAQVLMSLEDSVCDTAAVRRDFNVQLTPLEVMIPAMAAQVNKGPVTCPDQTRPT